MTKDYCTWFPEKWIAWNSFYKWKIVPVSDCCKIHDQKCSTRAFYKCLKRKRLVGLHLITLGGALGCWFKYTSNMIKRI